MSVYLENLVLFHSCIIFLNVFSPLPIAVSSLSLLWTIWQSTFWYIHHCSRGHLWFNIWPDLGTTITLSGICLSHLGFSLGWPHFHTASPWVLTNMLTSSTRLTFCKPNNLFFSISRSKGVSSHWTSWVTCPTLTYHCISVCST